MSPYDFTLNVTTSGEQFVPSSVLTDLRAWIWGIESTFDMAGWALDPPSTDHNGPLGVEDAWNLAFDNEHDVFRVKQASGDRAPLGFRRTSFPDTSQAASPFMVSGIAADKKTVAEILAVIDAGYATEKPWGDAEDIIFSAAPSPTINTSVISVPVSIDDLSTIENQSPSPKLKLRLAYPAPPNLQVRLTATDGTAHSVTDYIFPQQTVTVPAGVTVWEVPFTIRGNNPSAESTRTFTVKIDIQSGVASVDRDEALVTIYDDDSGALPAPVLLLQPEDQTAAIGSSVTLSVKAAGSSLTYQWFKDNTVLAGKTSAALVLTNVQTSQSGRYRVKASGTGGFVLSRYAKLTVPIPDSTLPTIAITSPSTNGTTATNSSLTVSGTASDNVGLTAVYVRVNSGGWVTASGTTSWSSPVTLVSGSNTIYAYSQDAAGNPSSTSSRTVTYSPADTTIPTVAITSPSTNGTTVTSSSLAMSGTASDNLGVTAVSVRVNSGSWVTASGTTSWYSTVSLNSGTNTIYAYSRDAAGNNSSIYSRTITYAPSSVATLSSLALSTGTLTPAFAPNTMSYTANVPNITTSLTVTPSLTESNATVKVDSVAVASGSASGAIALAEGSNTISAVVTAQDGFTKRNYTITVIRATAPEIAITGNGINITTGDSSPSSADNTDFGSVEVTGGTLTRTFTITNSGTAMLNLISPVPPNFVELMAPSGFSVTKQATSPVASGGGTTTFSITFDPSSIGINTAIVSFMYDDEPPFSSTFNFSIQGTGVLSSNANLSNLVVNTAPLSPSFASSTTSYTASVSYSTTSVTVTPTVADTTASVKVNNVAVTSGSASGALALAVGSNTITTLATAQDGSTRAYTVIVTRAAPPAPEIAVSGNTANIADGSAQPSPGDHTDFGNVVVTGATLTRTFTIQNIGTAGLTLGTVTVSGTHAADFSVTSAPASSVAAGDSTTFQVTFDPSDYGPRIATLSFINNDGDENPFSFSIQGAGVQSSNADLSNLVVNTGAMAPSFVSDITSYTVGVSNVTSSIIVTPTVADSNASVRVNGTAVTSGSASGPVSLNSTGPNVITILVTAPDGSTKNYTLNASPVLAWGHNSVGQTTVPAGLSGVVAIAAGDAHTVALKSDGTVMTWGDDGYGQVTVPAGLSGVNAIAAGETYTMALKNNGAVVSWGSTYNGPMTLPAGLSGVTAIAAGSIHAVALKNNGTVVAWGSDFYGQTTVPAGLSGVIDIAAGYSHNVALKSDGTVVAWGNNDFGQTTVPAGLSGVTAIAAGLSYTVALKNDGTVVAWGDDSHGEVTVPAGLSGVTAIAAGYSHTVALIGASTDIAVEQTAGTGLVDGASSVNFGMVNTGRAGAVLSFVIKNMGSAPLTRLAITKDGAKDGEYVVTSPLVKVLAAGARTTFTVKFAPLAAGPRSALIHIGSNDMDENSFDIALTGTGVARPAITTQPVGPLLVGTGEAAGFTVASDSAVPPVYKWLKNGLFITGATSAQYDISNAKITDAGAYSAAVTNAAGSATSSAARLGVVSLATTDVTVNEAATLTLTVSKSIPAGAVLGYQWKKNGGDLANGGVSPAQVLSGATGTTLSITKAAAANAGSYSCVVGMDGLTKESGVFNVSVRLKPVVNAAGPFIWFTGDLVTEQMVAVNNPTTFAFTGLPAGVTGNTVTGKLSGRPTAATISAKTFTVTASNLAGTSPPMVVSYTVAALPAYGAGSYNGLVKASTTEPDRAPLLSNGSGEDGTTADMSTEGFFTAKVESSGAFSGKLTIDGLVLSVAGIFDHNGVARFGTNGAASVTVSRLDKLALTLALNLDLTAPIGNTGKLRGTVTQKLGTVVQAVSNIDADRAHYSTANKVPVNLAGTAAKPYTLVFPAKTQSPVKALTSYPQGDGFATMTVNVNGTVSLTGKLADDTVITASTPLSKLNLWPIFAQLYTLKGSIAGMAALTDANGITEDVSGTNLQWFRPAQNVQWYPNGWPAGISVDVKGARYVVPPALPLVSVFPLTTATDTDGNAALSFTGGLLSPLPLPYNINISTANLATNAPVAASPTMLITKTTGLITGTFTHSDLTKPKYQGVIIQKGSKQGGWGYFMSRATPLTYFGESGRVQVQAK
jgi:hypothetical protein